MRTKIIAVNAIIVLIVGLLSFVVVRASLASAVGNVDALTAEARHDVQGGASRIQLDGLRAERWLAAKVAEPSSNDPLTKADPSARGDAATQLCDSILAAAKSSSAFEGRLPSLVVLVDRDGKAVGRNGSTLERGEDLGALYPAMKAAVAKGQSGSDVWANEKRHDQFLASYAPVHDEQGKVAGAVVLATTLNDSVSRIADTTARYGLVLAVAEGDNLRIVARSASVMPSLADAVNGSAKSVITGALTSGHASAASLGEFIASAAPLDGMGDGKRAVLVAAAPATLIENAGSLATPILGVMALGLLLVVMGGIMLANYITRPINMLEEGLLAILNGQSDKRFELQHDDLGGLAFRIDQLLNQLMGVEEDNTDDEGRPSRAPAASTFTDVDQNAAAQNQQMAAGQAAALAAEPEGAYYGRIYREYITAKKALGEQTDHITEATFVGRIQSMEKEAAGKEGKPVRYQVKATGREVVLIAVPLP
ncbi:MAG: MXAN_5187 C-terminal domain-containing protein [Polyangiaceae bacterium]